MKKQPIWQNAALVKFLIVLFSTLFSYFMTYHVFRSESIWIMIAIASVLAAVLEIVYLQIIDKKN